MSPGLSCSLDDFLCLIFFVLGCCFSPLLLWAASYGAIRRVLVLPCHPLPPAGISIFASGKSSQAIHSASYLLVTASASQWKPSSVTSDGPRLTGVTHPLPSPQVRNLCPHNPTC